MGRSLNKDFEKRRKTPDDFKYLISGHNAKWELQYEV
jgi:hypothetical protein